MIGRSIFAVRIYREFKIVTFHLAFMALHSMTVFDYDGHDDDGAVDMNVAREILVRCSRYL